MGITKASNLNGATEGNYEKGEIVQQKRLSARQTFRIVLRNSIIAAVARVVIGILKLIVKRGLCKSFFHRLSGEVLSLNPLKWAAVASGFSSFRFCLQTASNVADKLSIPKKIVVPFCGTICSLPIFVMNKETRTNLSLYAFVRAAHAFSLQFILPNFPTLFQEFEHYDVLLMCLSTAQIVYGWLFAPFTIPISYRQFLLKASTLDERLIRGHTGFLRGYMAPEIVSYCYELNTPLFSGSGKEASDTFCQYIHSGMSCNMCMLWFIPKNMLNTGIPLYGPLRVASLLTTQRKRLRAQPMRTILRGVRSVFMSSLFIALYAAWIVRMGCFSMQNRHRGGFGFSLLCFFAGFFTLLEPKDRRIDLALYCFAYALRSFLLTQNRMGRLPYPRHWLVLCVYFVSTNFLFLEYEEGSNFLHPRVRFAFRLLLGEKSHTGAHKLQRHHHRHNHHHIVCDGNKLTAKVDGTR